MSNPTGTLYIVATPIGNLGDLSPRAGDILSRVELIAVEDTRHSARLLDTAKIRTPLTAFHDHNATTRTREIVKRLEAGDNVALICDAGTPLISDQIGRASCRERVEVWEGSRESRKQV